MIKIKAKKIKQISPLKIRKMFIGLFWFLFVVMIIVGIRNISYNKNDVLLNNQTDKFVTSTNNNYDIGIVTFSNKFINAYFSFSENEEERKSRSSELKKYMLDEMVNSTSMNISEMSGVKSTVNEVEIWGVEQKEPFTSNNHRVSFTVYQELTMADGNKKNISDSYYIVVHKDDNSNYVVIQNPTVTTSIQKGEYEVEETLTQDTTISSEEKEKINEFLNMFFKVYPKVTEHELTYYVKENIKPLDKNLELVSLNNLMITNKDDNNYSVSVDVIYKNIDTNFQSINHFEIELVNKDNKLIISSF